MKNFRITGEWKAGEITQAETMEKALENIREEVEINGRNWDESEQMANSTLYIDIGVKDEETDDIQADTVVIEPNEPECIEKEHNWETPYSVLGGLKENPGVWGHGGGVIYKEICSHCGIYRITDTWAQRSDTGEQGLREVSYEDADEGSLAWIEEGKQVENS